MPVHIYTNWNVRYKIKMLNSLKSMKIKNIGIRTRIICC